MIGVGNGSGSSAVAGAGFGAAVAAGAGAGGEIAAAAELGVGVEVAGGSEVRFGAGATAADSGVGAVAVWLVGDLSSAVVADLSATLDPDERRRAARFSTPEACRRFVIAHGAMRRIVAESLGAPPSELRWSIGPQGKPELAGPWTGVHANLSHSGGRCLIAVSRERAVGADIQRLVPGLDVHGMARRYFPASEAQEVADSPDPSDAFARLWARKEAVTKAAGGRLTQVLPLPTPLNATVELAASAYRVVDVDVDVDVDGNIGVGVGVDLAVPPGFRAAVALAGAGPFRIEVSQWLP